MGSHSFANIGVDLVSKIASPLKMPQFMIFLRTKNSVFLIPINEEEIINIIRTCNNKPVTDSNDINIQYEYC